MTDQLRYDGKVVIVTGGGNGLGKAYCLFFASRGAKVVVNDLGSSSSGQGGSQEAAQKVADEIKAAGGVAVADFNSVEFGPKIVQTAMDKFGRVDILINNAGILRDVSFLKMKNVDWELIMKVHLKGTYSVTRAAWNIMRDQGYGRIVNTSSAAGLYGNFGQANYSAAKLGIHGLTQTLAKEGEKKNIRVNTIAPLAASRMTESVMPKEVLDSLKTDYIVPVVAYLAHDSCEETGSIFEVAAGYVSKLRWQRSEGGLFDLDFGPEQVKQKWNEVCSFDRNNEYPTSAADAFSKVNQNIERIQSKGSNTKTSTQASSASTDNGPLNSAKVFGLMQVYLDRGEGKHLISKVGAVFGFEILEKKGGPVQQTYSIDLKNGQGKVTIGQPKGADAVFTMVDSDFVAVCQGKLNPQNAFMTGKMKIKGNMGKANKFTPDLFPPPTPENLSKYAKASL